MFGEREMFAARESSRIVVYSKSASATWLSVAVGVAGVGGSRGRSIFVLVVWRCLAAAGTIGDVWVRVGVHPWCILNLNGFLVAGLHFPILMRIRVVLLLRQLTPPALGQRSIDDP